jgi:hypothetical protein
VEQHDIVPRGPLLEHLCELGFALSATGPRSLVLWTRAERRRRHAAERAVTLALAGLPGLAPPLELALRARAGDGSEGSRRLHASEAAGLPRAGIPDRALADRELGAARHASVRSTQLDLAGRGCHPSLPRHDVAAT